MEWTGEAIVLGTRKHGENSVIVEVMSAEHGRHCGLVRAGRSRRMAPVLQPGNTVQVTWRARLATQLGQFTVELVQARAAQLMSSALGLHGIQHLAILLRLLPERDAHPELHAALKVLLGYLDQPAIAAPLLIRFELFLMQEIGFGLDLSRCAATGGQDDLAYVSPKSARAVSRDAGRPYHDKLLPLPSFLIDGQRQPGSEISYQDICEGFRLSGYFLSNLSTRLAGHSDMPDITILHNTLLATLEKHYRTQQPWNFIEQDN